MLVSFLVSKKSSYITGEVININGGIYSYKYVVRIMKRVVITGMGIYSCIGKNLAEVKNHFIMVNLELLYDEERKDFGYRSPLTGMVESPDLKNLLSRRERISLGEEGELMPMLQLLKL